LQNWNSVPIKQIAIPPSSQPLAPTIPFSVSVDLTSLGTSYKWNYTVFCTKSFCVWLISLSVSSRFIYVIAYVRIAFPYKAEISYPKKDPHFGQFFSPEKVSQGHLAIKSLVAILAVTVLTKTALLCKWVLSCSLNNFQAKWSMKSLVSDSKQGVTT